MPTFIPGIRRHDLFIQTADMSRIFFISLLFFASAFFTAAQAQDTDSSRQRLKVFIDCRDARCDMVFIKTEITVIDYLVDRLAADVHILINSFSTGGGGNRYTILFLGQNRFARFADTLTYFEKANTTDAESRELLVKHLQLGLVPYIIKTGMLGGIQISMKPDSAAVLKEPLNTTTKDPWNYWMFTVNADGNVNGERQYRSYGGNFNVTASRVTEAMKLGLNLYGSSSRSTFIFETDSTRDKFIARNSNYGVQQYYVKSINDHWSAGYEVIFNNNTFSNFKRQLYFRAAAEYNIFPYQDINNRYLAISYSIVTRLNRYYDTTIYYKLRESLLAHMVRINLLLNKKWGTISSGLAYHNFFHDWKLNSLTMNVYVNVRITGGLSFYISSSAGIVHDQVNLAKAGASDLEVLSRIRQLKSSYYYQNRVGVSYRFGSKLNNFVNPRFDGG